MTNVCFIDVCLLGHSTIEDQDVPLSLMYYYKTALYYILLITTEFPVRNVDCLACLGVLPDFIQISVQNECVCFCDCFSSRSRFQSSERYPVFLCITSLLCDSQLRKIPSHNSHKMLISMTKIRVFSFFRHASKILQIYINCFLIHSICLNRRTVSTTAVCS